MQVGAHAAVQALGAQLRVAQQARAEGPAALGAEQGHDAAGKSAPDQSALHQRVVEGEDRLEATRLALSTAAAGELVVDAPRVLLRRTALRRDLRQAG